MTTFSSETMPLRADAITKELYEKLSDDSLISTKMFRSERFEQGEYSEIEHSFLVGDALIMLKASGGGDEVFSCNLEITWNKSVGQRMFGSPPLSQCETKLVAKLLSKGGGELIDSPEVAKRPVLAKLKAAMGISDASHAQILAAVIANSMNHDDFLEYFALDKDYDEKKENNLYWQVQHILEAHSQSVNESKSGGDEGPAAKKVKTSGEQDGESSD